MARVPYVELSESSSQPELAEQLSRIAGLGRSVHNHHRALANHPPALRAFMDMSEYIRDRSTVAPRLRELVVLATAYALNVPYEIHYHTLAARRVGVSERQLAAFPHWSESDAFDATERAVLSFGDQVARRREVDDATFEQLQSCLSAQEIVDLALIAGWYHLCAALLGSLQIEHDPHHP